MTLRGVGGRELIAQCATRRPDWTAAGDLTVATMLALRWPAATSSCRWRSTSSTP
jgi:hypothetical protein